MARSNPALAIIGVAGLGVFAWLNWSRIKQVGHTLFADIGGQPPQWVDAANKQSGYIPPAPVVEVQISDLALGPLCRDFPQLCGLQPPNLGK